MSPAVPSMRAAHLQQNIDSLQDLGADAAARVLARVAPETIAAIRASTRAVWLPVEYDVELSEAVTAALGPRALRDWSRDALRKSMDSALLRGFIAAARRVFGLSPAGFFSWCGQGWSAIYRDCGALRLDARAERGVRLVLERVPPVMADAPSYLEGVAGAFEAVLDVCRVRGSVAMTPRAKGSPTAVFEVEWS